jgi:pilus assembly protein Flp/PilA
MIDSSMDRMRSSANGAKPVFGLTKACIWPYIGGFLMHRLMDRLRRDDEGAALVEYGMLVGLIAVICVVAVTTLGTEVSTAFSRIASALTTAGL